MPTPLRAIRVPDELWQAAQAAAARNGETVTAAVTRFLVDYVKGVARPRG